MAAALKHIISWVPKSFTRQKLHHSSANNSKSGMARMFGVYASSSPRSPRSPPLPSNALLQKRRGLSNKNIVSNENNLLPCLSQACTSSLLAAAQLQRRTNTFSLRTKPLFMTVVHNSLQGDQDKVMGGGGRVT